MPRLLREKKKRDVFVIGEKSTKKEKDISLILREGAVFRKEKGVKEEQGTPYLLKGGGGRAGKRRAVNEKKEKPRKKLDATQGTSSMSGNKGRKESQFIARLGGKRDPIARKKTRGGKSNEGEKKCRSTKRDRRIISKRGRNQDGRSPKIEQRADHQREANSGGDAVNGGKLLESSRQHARKGPSRKEAWRREAVGNYCVRVWSPSEKEKKTNARPQKEVGTREKKTVRGSPVEEKNPGSARRSKRG